MTELERLEQKTGHVTTKDEAALVAVKVSERPGELTDRDLIIADHFFGKAGGARARAAREQALSPPAPVMTPAAAPTTTEARRATIMLDATEYLDTSERREAVFERLVSGVELDDAEYELLAQPAPAFEVLGLKKFCKDSNEMNKRRNEKIAALEQRVAELEGKQAMGELPTASKARVKFLGSWLPNRVHFVDDLVTTEDGSVWRCELNQLHSQPGVGIGWRLVRAAG